MKLRTLLTKLFQAAVQAAHPLVGIRAHLPAPPASGRTVVVGAGKGSAQMAAALAGKPLADAARGPCRHALWIWMCNTVDRSDRGRPFDRPAVLLSGGETAVTLRGEAGRGGRNSEFALALALGIDGLPVAALSADTDGVDGVGNHAGALVDGGTIARLRASGFDARKLLARNDSYSGFEAIGDLLVTGPTGTNVSDFSAIVID